jgi:hypothetical protein
MNDNMTGSDGIERTLNEWSDHILRKTAYGDGDDPLTKEMEHLQSDLKRILSGEDHMEAFGIAAGEYFKAALLDSIEKGNNKDGIVSRLQTKARSLADSLDKSKWTTHGRVRLGRCLAFYMEEHDDLPRNRKELHQFSNGKVSMRTMSEHLAWFGLDKICATYHKD